ncbi:hypothetical protein ACFSQD_18640 [Flavihumibacter stibioxidans]|uniref:Secreted protein n=1 Tax=Flavihumibacter stibioxidans TaxID=1834163 RepID=A0ABR7MCL7_9BACT|nr:hypothetical protein [Flavihumibacter stibioxidans]MBC6492569.1 hypothetical protein [Flavihumibacter stibioxidans]
MKLASILLVIACVIFGTGVFAGLGQVVCSQQIPTEIGKLHKETPADIEEDAGPDTVSAFTVLVN